MLVIDRLIGLASPAAALRRAIRLSRTGQGRRGLPAVDPLGQGRDRRSGIPRRALLSRRLGRAAEPGGGRALARARGEPRPRRGPVPARRVVRAWSRQRQDRRVRGPAVRRRRTERTGFCDRPQMGPTGRRGRRRQGSGRARLCPDLRPGSDPRPRRRRIAGTSARPRRVARKAASAMPCRWHLAQPTRREDGRSPNICAAPPRPNCRARSICWRC